MSLKFKAMLVQGVLFALFFLVSLPAAYLILDQGLQDIEEHRAERIVERILRRIDYEQRILTAKAGDWALWEDTVQFVESPTPAYIERNLTTAPFQELFIHYMSFYDSQGRFVYAKGYDPETQKPIPWSQKTEEAIQRLGIIQKTLKANQESLQGLALIGGDLVFLSVRAIRVPGKAIATPKGALIMIRILTPKSLESLIKTEDFRFEIRPLGSDTGLPFKEGFKPEGTALVKEHIPTLKVWQGKQAILAYRTLRDIQGQPVGSLRVEIPTLAYEVQARMLWIIGSGLLLLAFILGISGYALLNRAILGRMMRLAEHLIAIGKAQDLEARVEVEGDDEIAQLARSINQMLEGLSSARQLEEAHRYVREIIEAANVGILVIDPKGNIYQANPKLEEIAGYSEEELLSAQFYWEKLFEPSSIPELKQCLSQTLETRIPSRIETRVIRKDGRFEAALVSIAPLTPQKHWKGERLVMVITDITQIKQLQEELRKLSFFDALTGVYNRTYFEQELSRLSKGRHKSIGLIIADVDLLKPINDTLGHLEGDKLLKKVAKLLKETFRSEDIVARIGGDEFAVILPGVEVSSLEKILHRLQAAIQEANLDVNGIPLSLSIGKAMTDGTPFDPSELIKEADRKMYQNKAQRRQQVLERMKNTHLHLERD